jgi:hypothetical protein
MDPKVSDTTSPSKPDVADPQRVAEPPRETARVARKPYVRPRLTEHGKLGPLTFAASGPIVKSDRNAKEGFEAVEPRRVLTAVVALPIERWSYRGEPVCHLGPMAQDFAAAFGLGADDRHIFPLDAAGVALAAIQGLHMVVQAQAARLEALESEATALRAETVAFRLELAMRETEPVA